MTLELYLFHRSHWGVTGIVKRFEYNRSCVHTYCMIICWQGGWDTLPAVGDGVVGFLLGSICWARVRLYYLVGVGWLVYNSLGRLALISL